MTNETRPMGRPYLYGERTRELRATCPDSVFDELDALAKQRETSRSRLVVEALQSWLAKQYIRGPRAGA